MNVTIKKEEGRYVVDLIGNLDTAASRQADKDLSPLYQYDDSDVLIDCSQLTYISSSGLRMLLSLYKHQRSTGHRVLIANINEDIEDVFRVSGFLQLFENIK